MTPAAPESLKDGSGKNTPVIHLRPRHQFPAPKLCPGLVAASEANQCHQLAIPLSWPREPPQKHTEQMDASTVPQLAQQIYKDGHGCPSLSWALY